MTDTYQDEGGNFSEFENALERALGDKMRSNDDVCHQVYAGMANIQWKHEKHGTVGYTWRCSGDVVAEIIGRGWYIDWYCGGDEGTVSELVRDAMASEGWAPSPYGDD